MSSDGQTIEIKGIREIGFTVPHKATTPKTRRRRERSILTRLFALIGIGPAARPSPRFAGKVRICPDCSAPKYQAATVRCECPKAPR